MRHRFAILFNGIIFLSHILLSCLALSSSTFAGAISVDSKIQSVTVFPTGAEITRRFSAKLEAGEQTIVLRLPNDLMPNSVRAEVVSNDEVTISSVGARAVRSNVPAVSPARTDIETQIWQLENERAALDRTIEDAGLSRQLVATLAQRKLQPIGLETLPQVPSPEELSSLLDLIEDRLAKVSKTVLDARTRRAEIDRRLEELKRRLASQARPGSPYSEVSVRVASKRIAEATLHLSYRMATASWQPIYQARLTTAEDDKAARLSLIQLAAVAQATAEPWDEVSLTLSTARPTEATSPPDLAAEELRSYANMRSEENVQRAGRRHELTRKPLAGVPVDAPAAGKAAVEKMQATAFNSGFQALYATRGRVTIDNSGASKSVRIKSENVNVELSLKAVPKLNLSAFLIARFASPGNLPLLPGPVMLFRDGVFVGEGALPRLSPGELFNLGFGLDHLVRIDRQETSHKSGETGLIASAVIDERSYLTVIDNLHSQAIPITILDQVPYATDDRIRIELLPKTTLPTLRDVDDKPGVYAWTMNLQAKSRKEVRFGFRVTWPKDMTTLPR